MNVDQAPAITSANSVSFTAGSPGFFTLETTGFPIPSLSESGALPSGITFADNHNGTGTLSGTTSASGSYPITFGASNGVGSPASQAFTLTVGSGPICTITWTGATSNAWSTATNWSPARTPTSSDWVCVPSTSSNLPVQQSGTSTVMGITNTGGLSVSGTLNLSSTSQGSTSTGQLNLTGTMAVAGTLNVSGELSTSGTLDGSGTTTVESGATFEVTSELEIEGGSLVNDGTATAEAESDLYVAAGATFSNKGALTLDSSSIIYGGCASAQSAAGTMSSSGTIDSVATSGFPSSIGLNNECLVFNDTGTIDIASNELELGGTTTLESGASVTGPSSTTLDIYNGTVTLDSGASISGPATIDGNGSLVLDTNLSVPNMHVEDVTGPGSLTVTSDLDVSELDGPGTTTVESGATFEVTSELEIEGGSLVNDGTATAEAESDLYVAAGATFSNKGALTLDSSSIIYGGCASAQSAAGTMSSSGTIDSVATSGFPSSIGLNNECLVFNDTGTIDIASNELELGGTTTLESGASVTGPSSTTLDIYNGTVTLDSGASISGPATIDGNGSLVLDTNLSVPNMHVEDVTGPGSLTVTSDLDVSELDGPGTTTVESGATFEVTSELEIEGGSLVNDGTATAEAESDLYVAAGATFSNKGALTLDSSSIIYGGCASAQSAAGTMSSSGTIDSVATSGFPSSIGLNNECLVFNDTGTIDIASNELELGGTTTLESGASVTGPSSTTLDIYNGTVTLDSGASISGPATIDGNGSLVLDTNLSVPNMHVEDVTGPGSLTVTSDLDVSELDGPGTTTVESGATFEVTSELEIEGGSLVNDGTATAEAESDLYVAAGATFSNKGALTLDSSSIIYGGCASAQSAAGTMSSSGTIDSVATSGFPSSIGLNNECLVFNDTGTIDIASNELELGGTTTLESGASVTGPSSTTLDIYNGTVTLDSGASISGPATIDGNGSLVLDTNLSVPNMHVEDVTGPGSLTVTSDLDVSELDGPGTTTVESGATFEVTSELEIEGGSLVNDGTATAEAESDLYVAAGATFTNKGALTLDSSSIIYGGCASEPLAAGTMTNTGTITSSAIQGYTASIGLNNECLVFNDTGSIDIASDDLDLGGTTNLNSGATLSGSSSTTLNAEGTLVANPGASFNGSDTVSVTGLLMAKTGVSLSTLAIEGTLEIAPQVKVRAASVPTLTGTIQLDGTGNFGQLVVSGQTVLGSAELLFSSSSYNPGCGASVTAVTSGSDSGGFSEVSGGNLPSGGSWDPTNTSTTAGGFVYCTPPPQPEPDGGPVPGQALYGQGNASMPDYCSCGTAEPVNLMSGNFYESDVDINVPSRGPNLNVTRTYNSLAATTNGPFGYGWSSNLGMNLVESDSDTVATVTDEQGSQVVFTLSGGVWSAPSRNSSTLTENSGTWTYSRWDGETFTFNANGELTSQTDLNGNRETFAYNAQSQLTTVTDASGRILTITWSGGHVSAIKDPDNQTVSYAYDSAGDLTGVTNFESRHDHTLLRVGYLLSTVTDPDNNTLTNTYNSAGQVTEQVDAMNRVTTFTYATPSSNESTTLVTDPNGDETFYTFEYGLMVQMTAAYDTPLSATTTYAHDPVSLGVTSETSPDGNTTTATYDSNGNVLTSTTPLGEETVNTYNSLNEVLTTTDPSGVETTNTYDADGNVLTTSTPLLNSSGGTTATATKTYTYGDPSNPGLPTKVEDPDGNTTTYTYDAYGDKTSITNPLGDETTLTYDILGRLLTEVAPDGNVSGCGCASSYTTSYTYNPLNELLTVISPNGDKTTNTYNGDADEITSTQPNGALTTKTYDADNELTEVEVTNGGALEQKTETSYDGDGNVASQTNGDGNVTTYSYNALDQQISSTNPLGQFTASTYDGDGNLLTVTDADGTTKTNTYNADDELVSSSYSDGTPPVTYTYDPEGRKVSMADGTGTSTSAYDSLGRMTSYTEGSGTEVTYGYDLDGNQTSITYPGGGTVSRVFNAADQMQSLSDLNNQSSTFTYDASGNLTQEALPNGVVDSYKYDGDSNVTSIKDKDGSSTIFAASYTLNSENVITQDTSQPTATGTYQYTPLNQVCYAASGNSNACSAPPNGSEAYAYDGTGNLTDDNGTTQSYNANSELCWSVAGASTDGCLTTPAGATTYAYDADGNLTAETPSSGSSTKLTYNGAEEMTQYQVGTSTPTSYTYDGDGLRMSKSSGGVDTSYAWDVSEAIPALLEEETGGKVTKYVYGPTGLPLEEILSNGKTYYYAHDNLGSTPVSSRPLLVSLPIQKPMLPTVY